MKSKRSWPPYKYSFGRSRRPLGSGILSATSTIGRQVDLILATVGLLNSVGVKSLLVVELCQKCIVYDEQVRSLAFWQREAGDRQGGGWEATVYPQSEALAGSSPTLLTILFPLAHSLTPGETDYSLLSLVATTRVLPYQDHSFSPVAVLTQHLSGPSWLSALDSCTNWFNVKHVKM